MKLQSVVGLIVFVFASCGDIGFDLRNDPSGTYRFTKFDSTGNSIERGIIRFTVHGSFISGEWNHEGGNQLYLIGLYEDGILSFDFLPGCMECLNRADGRLVGGAISGRWYIGSRTIERSGDFVAEKL